MGSITPTQSTTRSRPRLDAFGPAWTTARVCEPHTGSFRLFQELEPQYPQATAWLRANYAAYFDALDILWEFGRWQRTFVLAYLARYFRVRVFGSDWPSLGLGGSERIDHDSQPAVYARGRIAINSPRPATKKGFPTSPSRSPRAGCR